VALSFRHYRFVHRILKAIRIHRMDTVATTMDLSPSKPRSPGFGRRDSRADSNPLYWSTLFLAPVAGALAAVGGLYLISFLNVTNVLGTSVSRYIGIKGATVGHVGAADLGVAFLLGFSAKLLGNLVTRSTSAASPRTNHALLRHSPGGESVSAHQCSKGRGRQKRRIAEGAC
jgi:hypothetical protein